MPGWFKKKAENAREFICSDCGRIKKQGEFIRLSDEQIDNLSVLGVKFIETVCPNCQRQRVLL
jgi:predicted RNA-binding Zn-ribbon protein involved in translation (DUF1610 family)